MRECSGDSIQLRCLCKRETFGFMMWRSRVRKREIRQETFGPYLCHRLLIPISSLPLVLDHSSPALSVNVAHSTRILPQRPSSSIHPHSTYCLLPSLPKTQTNIVQTDSYLLITLPKTSHSTCVIISTRAHYLAWHFTAVARDNLHDSSHSTHPPRMLIHHASFVHAKRVSVPLQSGALSKCTLNL